jgi:two-component system, LytTR family, sensor kinase
MPGIPGIRSKAKAFFAVWAFWTGLALFFSVSASLTYVSTGRPANWSLSMTRSLSEWWLWALLTPLVTFLARRFPLYGPHARRHVGLHAVAGLVLGLAKTLADRVVFAMLTGFWPYMLVSTLALQVFVYAAIVAAAHGLEYYRRSRERDQLEARLAETRLQLLNMQLQPHFLFNTLNTIAELVHEDPESADRMIAKLSELLRRTLHLGGSQEITLDAELELLSLYIDLQKARFGDRLKTSLTIDPAARPARVPMLLLQPLVENAIRHGLAAHVNAGRVDIEARRIGDDLSIEVTDDGPGLPDLDVREGIGLGNTRARLGALYPDSSSLELMNVPQRGARVSVRIPFRMGTDGR